MNEVKAREQWARRVFPYALAGAMALLLAMAVAISIKPSVDPNQRLTRWATSVMEE